MLSRLYSGHQDQEGANAQRRDVYEEFVRCQALPAHSATQLGNNHSQWGCMCSHLAEEQNELGEGVASDNFALE